MEYIRLKDIDIKEHINNRIFICFMVSNVEVRPQKDKSKNYITFNMVDKENAVKCSMFDVSQASIEMITNGKVFNAGIDVKPYDKSSCGYSCIVYNIEESDCPSKQFLNWADNLEYSYSVINNAISSISNSIYGKIAYPIIKDNLEKLCIWPAGRSSHHNRLGDLLTHTAEVVEISEAIYNVYTKYYGNKFLNKELLIASALLHDIGKIKEMDTDIENGNVTYSENSALSTHIMNMLSTVDIQCYKMNIGQADGIKSEEEIQEEVESIQLLKHCIASHHGKLEWGSPIIPSMPESMILSRADDISAETFRYSRIFKEMGNDKVNIKWINGGSRITYKDTSKHI